jgi:hypothetical protein
MISFTYTKPSGEVSNRVALVLSKPSDNYLMLDLSDLDSDEIDYLEQRVEQYESERKALLNKFNFDPYIKSFKASRMTICTE